MICRRRGYDWGLIFVIGESGANGWVIFLVYLMAAWLCFRNARGSLALPSAGVRRVAQAQSRRRFWLVLALLILLLGISRQFDLQALAANAMRSLLLTDDVYGERSGLQIGLIAAIGGFGTLGLLVALVTFRRAEMSVLAALAGGTALVLFTLVRAISLHDIDHVLGHQVVPYVRVNALIELCLLSLIAIAAFRFDRNLKDESRNARLRAASIKERRRLLGEKRRAGRS